MSFHRRSEPDQRYGGSLPRKSLPRESLSSDSHRDRDRGAVDVSVQMLFGFMALLFALLLLFEVVAYWHARNVFDEAAAEGVRVAAAYDGDCAEGIAAAEALVRRHGGSWSNGVRVTCVDGAIVTVTVAGRTPGVLGNGLGFRARVSESAPKEG